MLEGKVAIVTGAGRGLGRAEALQLAKMGARVVVNDLGVELDGSGGSESPAQQVVEEIAAAGGEAIAHPGDVADWEDAQGLISRALETFGGLDILVNNAGFLRDRMVFNMSEEEWDAVLGVHLKGTFACSKAAAILFRQQRSGRILTFTSTSGLYGNTGQCNYSAAKSGIAGFTKVISLDLGRYGVTVNSIAPMAGTRMTLTDEYFRARKLREDQGITREGFGDFTTNDVEEITGHPARSYETFARDFCQEFAVRRYRQVVAA